MSEKNSEKLFTVPNMVSLFRLALIPVFIWLYNKKNTGLAGCAVIFISGASDILDGYIARKFDMVSNAGKILDPIADKLTQAVTLLCLAGAYPLMLLPLAILFFKETLSALMCFLAIRKSGRVQSSDWHGKLNTVLLYFMFILHLLWEDIPQNLSDLSIWICVGTMLFSAVMYTLANLRILRRQKDLP